MKFVIGMNATIKPGSVPIGLEGYDPAAYGDLASQTGTVQGTTPEGEVSLFGWWWKNEDVKPLV